MKKLEFSFKPTLIIPVSLILVLNLFACAPFRVGTPSQRAFPEKAFLTKSYHAKVSRWKSYEDLVKWMEKDFSFDMERYKKFEGTLPIPRTPEETLYLKSGIYIDAAEFSKKTLNQINPLYQAQIVVIIVRPNTFNHYVCSFRDTGRLFILDYGTPYKETTGFLGPYHSLEEYKSFYENHHPEKRHVEWVGYLLKDSEKR